MTGYTKDFRSFTGIRTGQEEDSNGVSYVTSVLGNDLRVGKYCMIGGSPCKIRAIHRAAPGKHGHAKLRTVGVGIFDGKKRETIFIAQHVVPMPVVENHTVQGETTKDGFQLESSKQYRLPPILSFPEEIARMIIPGMGQHAELSIVTACGNHKITAIRTISVQPTAEATSVSHQHAMSKKELRKRKKQLRKQESITTADGIEAQSDDIAGQSHIVVSSSLVETR